MSDASFWTRFVLAALATWRVTHLFAKEDGPADLIVRLRARMGNGIVGKLIDCFYCLSVWIAAPAALFVGRSALELFFTWLALSAAACLLERIGQQPLLVQPIAEAAEEVEDGVLWSESAESADNSDSGRQAHGSRHDSESPGASALH